MNTHEILYIHVLGGLETRCGSRRLAFPTRYCALLLAILAISPNGVINREACAALLWGERGDEQARASLRQAIYHAQKVLGASGATQLAASRQEIGLKPGCWQSDIGMIRDALQDDPVLAASLYKGELLAGVGRVGPTFEDWMRTENQEISNAIAKRLAPAADAAAEAGKLDELEKISAALLRIDALDEQAVRHNMTALAGLNRRPASLKAFQSFETTLYQELGVAPEPETILLKERLQSKKITPSTDTPDLKSIAGQGSLGFKERRTVSLVLLRPAHLIHDPEDIAHWLDNNRSKLGDRFRDTDVRVMSAVGASLACVFGSDRAIEYHSEKAALAAIELHTHHGEGIRLAVVSGDIVQDATKPLQPDDTAAIAHLVEEAASLSNDAPSDQPVVSKGVAARLGLTADPEASGVSLQEGDLEAQVRQTSRFVARESELAELTASLEASAAGNGRVVGVMGEAGIGKSSLVAAFVANKQYPILHLEAKARDSDQPYSAVAGLFRRWVSPDIDVDIEKAIDQAVSSGQLASKDMPALRDVLGLPVNDPGWAEMPSGLRRRQIHQLAISTIIKLTRGSTAILIAEDLHWMDPESLSLLDQLIDELTALPLCVVATYRTEFQNDWIGRSFFRLIRMTPLKDEEAQNLLSQVLNEKHKDTATRQAIVDRCGGIPYFLVETARALERGEALSTSIRDVLAAHVQTLPPRERLVMQCAAILGIDVEPNYVEVLSALNQDELQEALAHLRKEELLLRQPGSAAYRFRHALLHDTVYASVPKSERIRLHSAAMDQYLGDKPNVSKDLIPVIARHAMQAQRWKDAVDWGIRTGDRYADLSSYTLAGKAYRTASDALTQLRADAWHVEKRVEIALKQRPVLVPLGQYEKALAELDRAENTVRKITNPILSASVHIGKSYLFSTHGRLNEAVAYAGKAGVLAPPDHQTAVEAKLALGQALSLMGDWQSTIRTLEPTLPFWETHSTERFGHTGTRAIWCHGHLSHAYILKAEFATAQEHANHAFAIATETARPLDVIFALHRLGEVYLAKGDAEEAISTLEEANSRAEEIDAPIFQVWFACDIVPAYLSLDRLEEARSFLSQQNTMANRLHLKQFLAWITLRRAELSLSENNLELAGELAEQALSMSRQIPDLVLEPEALLIRSMSLKDKGALHNKAKELIRDRRLLSLETKLLEL